MYELVQFEALTAFTGSYRQHNAALKFLRGQHESWEAPFETAPVELRADEPAAVAAILKGKGMAWEWDWHNMLTWSWLEMIAQLDAQSMQTAVRGPQGRSGGLVSCQLVVRPNSYDHKRHHQQQQGNSQWQSRQKLPIWDFLLLRDDGSGLRMHPQWGSTVVECYEVEGHAEEVQPPQWGLGKSDGPGTYKRFKQIGASSKLRFDAEKGRGLPPGKHAA